MSDYPGTYLIVNACNGPITNLVVAHTCGSYSGNLILADLAAGEVSQIVSFNSQTSEIDYWNIHFDCNGTFYDLTNYQCNYETSDSGHLCVISLNESYVNVITPISSTCRVAYTNTSVSDAVELKK
ncbi:hypothetical protein [Leptospira alstonii]|uniref:hypothetical protein n=1 Tax=Leptospira alstonii TaxID=28452 RepID=UPI000B2AA694|nr:hypothetical protein [Leptospira alstonii]